MASDFTTQRLGNRTLASAIPHCHNHNEVIMKNIKQTLNGTILTLEIDLSKNFGQSGSGKSIIIASTEGNKTVDGTDDVKIGVNVYRPVK